MKKVPGFLASIEGIGPQRARLIVSHRDENGPFTSMDGVEKVQGISASLLEKLRERATVSPGAAEEKPKRKRRAG